MKTLGFVLLALVAALLVVLLWGPREPVDREISFDPASLPDAPADLDAWLNERESGVPALREANAKRIHWAGTPGERTPLSVVYLHGYSASSEEIRPVPDKVAEALGANLFFTRLSGHGRDGAAMAEPVAGDWIEDTAEAMAIGRAIGERVLVVSASTGGTLAGLVATDPVLSENLAGVVLVSPNFRMKNKAAGLLTLPFVRTWGPMVAGAERGFEPQNDAHAAHWTYRYPTVSTVPLMALVSHVAGLDFAQAGVPALFIYSREDKIVDAEVTDGVHDTWGGPVERDLIVPDGTGDASNHLLIGDIVSPERTQSVSLRIAQWAAGL